MEELKQRILQDGLVIDNRILKIDSFLNQQIDTALINHVGQEFARRFKDVHIDRIITIESSGIAVAYAASLAMNNCPVVFARKKNHCSPRVNSIRQKFTLIRKKKSTRQRSVKTISLPGNRFSSSTTFWPAAPQPSVLRRLRLRPAAPSKASASSSKRPSRPVGKPLKKPVSVWNP